MHSRYVMVQFHAITEYCTADFAHHAFRLMVRFLDVLFEILLIVKNDTACFTAVFVDFFTVLFRDPLLANKMPLDVYLILLVAGERFATVFTDVRSIFVIDSVVFNDFIRRYATLLPTIGAISRMEVKVDDERFSFPIAFITK